MVLLKYLSFKSKLCVLDKGRAGLKVSTAITSLPLVNDEGGYLREEEMVNEVSKNAVAKSVTMRTFFPETWLWTVQQSE